MKKRILSICCLLLVAAALCASGKTEQSSSTQGVVKSNGVTEIVFLSSSVKPYDTAIPEMIKKFEALNPDIKVKVEMLPTQNLWELVEIKMGAKEAVPDVLWTDSPLITSYVTKGYLEPLDAYFTKEELDQFVSVPLESSKVNGKLYAVPFQNSSQVLYYNTALFDEAGIPRLSKDPKDRLTWEALVEIAQKLTTDKNNDGTPEVFGLGISQISRPYQMLTMPLSLGGEAIGKDGMTISGVLTTPPWIKATQFLSDIFNKYKVSPKGVSPSDMLAYFPSEKIAMLIGPDYNMKSYAAMKDLKWDYAPYPYFAGGKAVTPTGSWHLGVNKFSKNKEAGVRLIKFLTEAPYCIDWFELDGHLPTNKNTLDYIAKTAKFNEWPNNIFGLINYESKNTAVPRPSTPAYLEYEQLLTNAFEDIRNGSDPYTTLKGTEERIERMLKKYK